MAAVKPLLVGEDNPYGKDPRYALYPQPEYSTGARLCGLIMQLSIKEYIRDFDRVNLCSGKWSMKEARGKASDLLFQREHPSTFVLLGSKVSAAFRLAFEPYTIRTHVDYAGSLFVCLPHPSGLNRLWNEHGSYERARETLRQAKVLP